jgi:hypothetical protein
VISCATSKLVEPSAADYTAALSTIYMDGSGWKDYTLPVWTTDNTNCPIDSYKLLSTSSVEIQNMICQGMDSGKSGFPVLYNSNTLEACMEKCKTMSSCKTVLWNAVPPLIATKKGKCYGYSTYTGTCGANANHITLASDNYYTTDNNFRSV